MPDDLPRFIEVGSNGARVAIEDAILHFLPTVVAGDEIGHTVFRITRDADFSVSGDADDLLEAVETQLLRRRFGDVVRLEVAAAAPTALVDLLVHQLHIDAAQVYTQRAPLGLREVGQLFEIDRPDLKDKPWKAITRRPFMKKSPAELLGQIRRRDVLVHHPYDSFDASVGAFAKAALDPKVGAFKATVYRTDDSSPTLSSLVQTAEKGKQAVCLVELKARFDERRNIEWSRALEQAGVDIVYGVPDLKIHAKLALLVRHEQNGLRRYVHIGTGNYHSSNASTYEDLGLFTADPDIAADVADVFNAVTGSLAAGRVPQAARRAVVPPRRDPAGDRAGLGRRARGRAGADPTEGQLARRRGDHRGAVRRVECGRDRRHRHARHLLPEAGHRRAERQHHRAQRARPLPRAQPHSLVPDRRQDQRLDRERRPDAAQPRPPDRGDDADRGLAPAHRDRRRARRADGRHPVLVDALLGRCLAPNLARQGAAGRLGPGGADEARRGRAKKAASRR